MLTQIHISHLVTIQELQLDFKSGTTVITGETGAGKSILIDAIALALGERATSDVVRLGQEKADISLCFDVKNMPKVTGWLKQHELDQDSECIIRRTINKEGRSRSYINGTPTTLQPLKELSELLISIHGQHEHQTLLKLDVQREMLDRFAGHDELIMQVRQLAEEWLMTKHELHKLEKLSHEHTQRSEFLAFQLQELQELELTPNEFATLDLEHKQLAHAGELVKNITHSLNVLSENEEQNAAHLLHQALLALEPMQRIDPKVTTWIESIKNALIHINDLENDLRHYLDHIDLDPTRLQRAEQRMSDLFDMARKHRIAPAELYAFQQKLLNECAELQNSDERITQLKPVSYTHLTLPTNREV